MYAHHSRFSHPVPLGTPSLDYGRMEVGEQEIGVTVKGSIWNPSRRADGKTFTAFWAQDGWNISSPRAIPLAELNRYKDATTKVFPFSTEGVRQAIAYAKQVTGYVDPDAQRFAPSAAPAAPSYYYAPAPGAPGTQPPATTDSGSITDKPWFWPAVGAGAIGLVALVWAFLPASSAPKVIIKRAASRFTGF
jgi:hypothetical protein